MAVNQYNQSYDAGFQWPSSDPTPVPTPNLPPLYPSQPGQTVSMGYPVPVGSGGYSPGDVAGVNTIPAPAPAPAPAPSDGFSMDLYPGWDETAARADYAATGGPQQGSGGGVDLNAQVRGEISAGWDTYIDQLNQMLNTGLPGQKSAQEGIITSQYGQGIENLGTEQTIGLRNLEGEKTALQRNQAKNLKDMAENIRNMFMSGNIYLGSRGAGDSSAANQYAYALTKLGSKARGNIMSQTSDQLAQIGQRETNLKTIYAQEKRNLASQRDAKILELANWFNEQQNVIRGQIGQAGLGRSQDLANLSQQLLQQATQKLGLIDQEVANKSAMLDKWAIENSENINQLRANMQGVASYKAQLPQAQMLRGTPQVSGGNYNMPVYYGTGGQQEKDIFGNVIG